MEEYSSGSAYNVVPALILRWPTFELILKNRIEGIFDVLCIFLPGSKYCSKEALEKLPIDSDISLVSEKLHLVLSRTKLSKSTLSWSMHFTQELRSSVAERAESTPKGKHTCWRIRIHSIYVSDCSFMCLSSKWGFSVTVLMSTAALVPPAPRCFECFPLGKKKTWTWALFTWRFSNPPVPLWVGHGDSLPVSILCAASFKVRGFGARVYDD